MTMETFLDRLRTELDIAWSMGDWDEVERIQSLIDGE